MPQELSPQEHQPPKPLDPEEVRRQEEVRGNPDLRKLWASLSDNFYYQELQEQVKTQPFDEIERYYKQRLKIINDSIVNGPYTSPDEYQDLLDEQADVEEVLTWLDAVLCLNSVKVEESKQDDWFRGELDVMAYQGSDLAKLIVAQWDEIKKFKQGKDGVDKWNNNSARDYLAKTIRIWEAKQPADRELQAEKEIELVNKLMDRWFH